MVYNEQVACLIDMADLGDGRPARNRIAMAHTVAWTGYPMPFGHRTPRMATPQPDTQCHSELEMFCKQLSSSPKYLE
jgi:hypothetical protein